MSLHNAVSFANDLSAEELLIITKSVVDYQLDSNCQILAKDQLRGKPDKWRAKLPALFTI